MAEIQRRRLRPFKLTVTGRASGMAVPGGTGGQPGGTNGGAGGGGGGSGLGNPDPPRPPLPSPPQVAIPTFSPNGGVVLASDPITITCATPGATIYYTTDGSTPTRASTRYTGTFNVSATTTVKAFAVRPSYLDSGVGSAGFLVNTTTPSLWRGAWAAAAVPSPNIMTTSDLGALVGVNAVASGGKTTISSNGSLAVGDSTPHTEVSFGGFVEILDGLNNYFRVEQSVSAFELESPSGAAFILFGGASLTPVANPTLSGETHVLFVGSNTGGYVKIYLNGVLTQTVLGNFGGPGSSSTGFHYFKVGNGGQARVRNFVVYRGILSAAAIASLAAGNMPTSAGELY